MFYFSTHPGLAVPPPPSRCSLPPSLPVCPKGRFALEKKKKKVAQGTWSWFGVSTGR